jgi:hypothetical protein
VIIRGEYQREDHVSIELGSANTIVTAGECALAGALGVRGGDDGDATVEASLQ